MCVPFLRFGKFLTILSSNSLSALFSLPSPSETMIKHMSFHLMASRKSLRLSSFFFILFYFFLSFINYESPLFEFAELLFCLVSLHSLSILVIVILNSWSVNSCISITLGLVSIYGIGSFKHHMVVSFLVCLVAVVVMVVSGIWASKKIS